MIPLFGYLPKEVTIGGQEYPISTDFRSWIEFEMMLQDTEFPDEMKALNMLNWYTDALPPSMEEAIEALVSFYSCEKSIPQGKGKAEGGEAVYDYRQDATLIYAGFLQAYNIDLNKVEDLHWWAFRALLEALPESTRMAQIMSIRGTDTSGMSGEQRRRHEKLKALCAIGREKDGAPLTLAQRNEALLKKARRIRKNAPANPQPPM